MEKTQKKILPASFGPAQAVALTAMSRVKQQMEDHSVSISLFLCNSNTSLIMIIIILCTWYQVHFLARVGRVVLNNIPHEDMALQVSFAHYLYSPLFVFLMAHYFKYFTICQDVSNMIETRHTQNHLRTLCLDRLYSSPFLGPWDDLEGIDVMGSRFVFQFVLLLKDISLYGYGNNLTTLNLFSHQFLSFISSYLFSGRKFMKQHLKSLGINLIQFTKRSFYGFYCFKEKTKVLRFYFT